jgi:hypothetical protein
VTDQGGGTAECVECGRPVGLEDGDGGQLSDGVGGLVPFCIDCLDRELGGSRLFHDRETVRITADRVRLPAPHVLGRIHRALNAEWEAIGRPRPAPPTPLILGGYDSPLPDRIARWEGMKQWSVEHNCADLIPRVFKPEEIDEPRELRNLSSG